MKQNAGAKQYAAARRHLKRYADIVQDISKVFAALSILAGPFIIVAYVSRLSSRWGNVPIAVSDLYGSALLPIVFLMALFLVLYFAFITLFNGSLRTPLERRLRVGFPFALRRYRLEHGSGLPKPANLTSVWRHLGMFFVEYLSLHAPALLLLACACVAPNSVWLAVLGFVLGVYVLYFVVLARVPHAAEEQKWRSARFTSHVWKTVGFALLINVAAIFAWSLAVWFFGQIYAATYGGSDTVTDQDVYISMIFVLFFDFLFFGRNRAVLEFSVAMTVLFAISVLLFQPSVVGATALRMIGLGGGMPASMLVKSIDAESKTQISIVRGCVVLNAGGQIVVEEIAPNIEANANLANRCRPRHWLLREAMEERKKQFCNLAVYTRSDAVIISSFGAVYNIDAKIRKRNDACG